MRDIKFRAWCNDHKRMFTKVLIGNTTNPDSDDYTAHCIFMDDNWYHSDEHDNVVLMQYTGLKDKNGVEIYEGDVITAGIRGGNVLSTYSVEYDSIYGCWYGNLIKSQRLGNKDCRAIGELRFNAEVIGNIHQNPELLNK